MSIKDLTSDGQAFFSETRKEIPIKIGGKKLIFYANEISYLENQNIGVQSATNGKNGLAMLVAASITDADGNKFTYDEILKLKKEIAKPFFDAALEVNIRGQEEKNSPPPTSSGAS